MQESSEQCRRPGERGPALVLSLQTEKGQAHRCVELGTVQRHGEGSAGGIYKWYSVRWYG